MAGVPRAAGLIRRRPPFFLPPVSGVVVLVASGPPVMGGPEALLYTCMVGLIPVVGGGSWIDGIQSFPWGGLVWLPLVGAY